jgi:chondroitin AC lyase
LLRPAKATAQVASQRGSWRKINLQYPEMPLYKNVFSLWIDHGIHPQLSAYAYMVVNGLSASQAALLSKQMSVNILHNTSEIQAAYDESSRATAAVFRVAGSLLLPSGHTLKVSAPSVIIVHDKPPGKITVGPLDARTNSVTVSQIAPNQTHRRWLAEFSRLPSAEKKAESPWPLETKAE